MLSELAPAKVNLYLHVLGRRPDGYHLLDSLAVFAGTGDVVRAEASDTLSLTVCGPFAADLDAGSLHPAGLAADRGSVPSGNLVLRAAHALAQAAGIPARARLVLDKRLPVASGIGGGSADAAATLRLLCQLWHLRPGHDDLGRLAAGLGADVPVCLAGAPTRMGGIGDVLSPGPSLPPFGLLLANPRHAVSTPEVFRRRSGAFSQPAALPPAWPDAAALAQALARCTNDLEAPARAICPAIDDTLAWLQAQPGALLARMSGSGATCFGIFADAAAASAAAHLAPPSWWAWGGQPHG